MVINRTQLQPSPLYRRLPPGPNAIGREEVARNQRARLYGAMIESIAERGYAATSVAHVIALAGVSRRAFYEQFLSKEHCFLATYDIVVARERKRVIAAWQGERGWTNRLHAACKTLLDDVAGDPKGPRLVLVDSLAIGANARERMQLAALTFERLVASVLELAPDGIELPALACRAIVGGIRHVVFMRMLEDRERELHAMTGEVLDWIEAYRSPAAARLAALGPRRPRHVPPAPAAFLESGDERARALRAVVRLTLEEGYSRLTDAQIAQSASLSTEAFREQFDDKQDCFLTVLDEFVRDALCSVRGPLEDAPSWPQAVGRAMGAFVEYLVGHRALLRIAFIDLFEVGPGIVGRLTSSIEDFTELLTEAAPAPRRGPVLAREAVTGAIWAVIASFLASGHRLSRLPCLVDQLTFIVLAPYIGAKAAVGAIETAHRSQLGA